MSDVADIIIVSDLHLSAAQECGLFQADGKAGLAMSPRRAIELCQTMYQMTFILPNDPHQRRTLLKMDSEQQALYDLLH